MNLNDFSKWLQYNKVKNLRGSEYFPYPLYILQKVHLSQTLNISANSCIYRITSSGGQSTQIKYLSKSTDTYTKILLQ